MKKSLTKLFSLLLTASMVFSASAQPLAKKASGSKASAKASVTAVAKKAPEKGEKGVRPMPKFRTTQATANNKLRTAAKTANLPVAGQTKKAPVVKEAADVPTLWGTVTFADGWTQENQPVGLYTIPSNASQDFDLICLGPNGNYGGVLVDGVYYTCEYFEFWGMAFITYVGYDVESGEVVYEADDSILTTSMELDPTTGKIYACINGLSLGTIDFSGEAPAYNDVVELPITNTQIVNSITIDAAGTVYAIITNLDDAGETVVSDELYKIDKTTGAMTLIGDTGETSLYMTDSVIDTKTGKMYWTISPADETGWLTEVDMTTGAATRIYHFPDNAEVTGLVIPLPAAEDKAPAAATDFAVDFQNGSLSGTAFFKTPATLFDGSAATGDVNYTVYANDAEIATGTAAYGSDVTANIAVEVAGIYNFKVVLSNEVGNSPKTQLKNVYVGNDTPEATSATLKYEDGKMMLSWLPVTTSVNGGYIDVDAITYTVTRYPGDEVVAEGLTGTTFEEVMPEPEALTQYYYGVQVFCGDARSAFALSNVVTLGSILPPYASDFAGEGLDGWTILDVNGDDKTWTVYNGSVRVQYNSSMAMNDWLITPPLKLEAGKLYKIGAKVGANSASYPERIEVKWGKGATEADMTNTLVEPTVLTNSYSTAPLEIGGGIIPEEDGIYYIGFHGISDADQYYLYVGDVTVSGATSPFAPEAAEGLTVEAWGSNNGVAVTFTTPTKAINGSDLTGTVNATVYRDNEVVKTYSNLALGQQVVCIDENLEDGEYTYSVVCSNDEGASDVVAASIYVGINYPSDLVGPKVVETSNPGEVTISWNAVTTDINGNYLDPSNVKYGVYSLEGNSRVLLAEVEGTSYTYQAVPAGEQDFVQFAVFPVSSRGEGVGDMTDMIAAGTPYTSFSMTNEEDLNNYILGYGTYNGGSVGVANDTSIEGITSVDGDNFYLYTSSQSLDGGAQFFTGKISLVMDNPCFEFYTYNIVGADPNEIIVSVREPGAAEWTQLKTFVVNDLGGEGWNKGVVDLTAYANKTVQIAFATYVKNYVYTMLDGIKVASLLDYDLALNNIAAPARVNAGADYTVDVEVINEGGKQVSNYSVELYADGELADTKAGDAISASQIVKFQFERSFSAIATEAVKYTAKVVFADDENLENNASDEVVVTPIVSKYPTVTDLKGEADANGVKLTWSEPNLENASADPITEDFENADSWTNLYGDWTFVDLDQSAVGGFQGTDVPGITPGETLGSFWIWDQAQLGNDTFKAHSGTKYLFALFRYDDGQSDEWAISPLLNGKDQTVSFWARSYSADYPEKIEVYASEGSTDPKDFVFASSVDVVPADWTEYSVDIPAGYTRFAIRSCATGSFMLMVDDVTFVPADAVADLSIVGYNIYRDGVKINEAPVAETEFVDSNVKAGDKYTYVVTAVYNKGESAGSNAVEVTATVSGVEGINAGVKVSAKDQNIVIAGAEGQKVAVYSADGKVVFAGVAEAKTVVPATKGIYVVMVNKTATKLIVK